MLQFLQIVPQFPKLSFHLKTQLETIEPGGIQSRYYPCLARLHDGTEVDRVYVVSEEYVGGGYTGPDQYQPQIRVADVASLTESPSRLPAKFASELHKAGESGMGYIVFTVVFSKWLGLFPCRRDFVTSSATVDFIEYPPGRGVGDIVSVSPHVGRRDAGYHPGPKYSWCIFSGEEDGLK
jgi:hypothetical protein